MASVTIPDPSLVVLIGAAGSGKSTLAARLFAPEEIVSSDALRAVVSGDEADQTATRLAFRILHRTVDRRLPGDLLTVVDATNASQQQREPLLRRARAAGLPAVAIVLDLPDRAVHRQNRGRARVVAEEVVDRHLAAVRATIEADQLTLEGFDTVIVVRSPEEATTLVLERHRSTLPAVTEPRV